MRLAQPAWLLLTLLVPLGWLRSRGRGRLVWPSLASFRGGPRGLGWWLSPLPPLLRASAVVCLAVALARPQQVGGTTRVAGRGVSLVLLVDRSSSMNARDFPATGGPITRLEGARRTLTGFVEGRPDDLLGLVKFADDPDLACPPTLDHARFLEAVAALRPTRPGDDGTNLGDAIAWGLEAARQTTPARKVLVLLTDGINSPAGPGALDPLVASGLARQLGVVVHTVALGRPSGGDSAAAARPDLALLRELSRVGGGRAFEAADSEGLGRVFRELDTLERSPVRGYVRIRYDETYAPWALGSAVLLVADRLLSAGRLRRLP